MSLRIRRKDLYEIARGEKRIEYRRCIPFYESRFTQDGFFLDIKAIRFYGNKDYAIAKVKTIDTFINGDEEFFRIHLGPTLETNISKAESAPKVRNGKRVK